MVSMLESDGRPAAAETLLAAAEAVLDRAPAEAPLTAFRAAPPELWWWLHTGGARQSPRLREVLPSLPDEAVQMRFTGKKGDVTLRDGFRIYQLFRELWQRHRGEPGPAARALEFGCGWGRITRFFLRDFPPDRLVGIDCLPEMVELCRRTNRWATFEAVAPLPPTHLAAESF
ncbi:MAG TPA: class I SAM-dependent methyltransferase, partial [Gemmataceae bacterium]|nr:class I SAM-dependent methyltransferase [Gemmataceae bacterium]